MRKKSENRANIIMPLHFGHSITPSPGEYVHSYRLYTARNAPICRLIIFQQVMSYVFVTGAKNSLVG
jgi:hypothetical protein